MEFDCRCPCFSTASPIRSRIDMRARRATYATSVWVASIMDPSRFHLRTFARVTRSSLDTVHAPPIILLIASATRFPSISRFLRPRTFASGLMFCPLGGR